jgi:tetratricopeptide (TPR) repeat protein
MKHTNPKHAARVFLCGIAIVVLITGCSSSKGIFSLFKFRDPGDEKTANSDTATRASAFMSQVKPAKGNPDSHYRLGVYYQGRGKYEEAIEEFRKTIAIDPKHVFAYNGLGIAYDSLKERARAREAYRMALAISPGDRYAYNNLGYSFILEGDYASAVTVLLEGLIVNENDAHMRNNLAMAYMALGEKTLARAEVERAAGPGRILPALENIEEKLGQLEMDRTPGMVARDDISSQDIVPVPVGNRFTERMTRSLARAKKAKGRSLAGPVDLKAPRLEPDYLMIAKKGPDTQPAASPDPDSCIRQVMKTRNTGDTDIINSLARRQVWF